VTIIDFLMPTTSKFQTARLPNKEWKDRESRRVGTAVANYVAEDHRQPDMQGHHHRSVPDTVVVCRTRQL
jgi:hypothetical protein